MNARRDSSDGPGAGSFGGRVLLIGAVVFAAAATGLLVLTDEQKWLRLGIVAALWAALTGAFLAARYRRQLTDQRDNATERQEIYELELEREIAARREFELEVEAEAKRKAEESSRDDIAALRDELQNMRQTLESLLGGEFLVERYALRAESTRMRSLPEDRSLAARRDLKHLPAAAAQSAEMVVPQVVREAETELIERIREVHAKPRREQPQARPEPRVPDSRPPSVPRGPERPRTDWPTPEPVKPAAPQPAAAQQRPGPHPARLSTPHPRPEPASALGSRSDPAQLSHPRMEPVQSPGLGARSDPAQLSHPRMDPVSPPALGARPDPAQLSHPRMNPVPPPAPGRRPDPAQPAARPQSAAARQEPAAARQERPQFVEHPAEVSDRWFVPDGLADSMPPTPRRSEQPRHQEPQRPADPAPRRTAAGWDDGGQEWAPSWEARQQPAGNGHRAMPEVYDTGAPIGGGSEQTSWLAQYNQANNQPQNGEQAYSARAYVPPQARPEPQPEQSAGRRHRADAAEEPSGGGRRRRADGQPSWQETVGRRAEESGSHASGRSVSELLANNGHDSSPRRRRRRED